MKEIDEIRKIDLEMKKLRYRRRELVEQAIKKYCPFRIGDKLPVTDLYHKSKFISAKRFSIEVKKTVAKWVVMGTLVDRSDAYEWPHKAIIDESVK